MIKHSAIYSTKDQRVLRNNIDISSFKNEIVYKWNTDNKSIGTNIENDR